MAKTRGKRAAASPPPAAEPEVKKQTKRGKKPVAAEPIIDADVNDKLVDAQVAPSANLTIPVDEHCPLANYRVYIDPESKVIYDASLNQVGRLGIVWWRTEANQT